MSERLHGNLRRKVRDRHLPRYSTPPIRALQRAIIVICVISPCPHFLAPSHRFVNGRKRIWVPLRRRLEAEGIVLAPGAVLPGPASGGAGSFSGALPGASPSSASLTARQVSLAAAAGAGSAVLANVSLAGLEPSGPGVLASSFSSAVAAMSSLRGGQPSSETPTSTSSAGGSGSGGVHPASSLTGGTISSRSSVNTAAAASSSSGPQPAYAPASSPAADAAARRRGAATAAPQPAPSNLPFPVEDLYPGYIQSLSAGVPHHLAVARWDAIGSALAAHRVNLEAEAASVARRLQRLSENEQALAQSRQEGAAASVMAHGLGAIGR